MNIKNKSLILVLVMTILTGVFSGCSSDDGGDATAPGKLIPKNGGAIQLGCVSIDTMNPLITEHASVSDFLSLIYEGLFVLKSDLKSEGVLAKGYKVSENNTVYTIELKDNVHFHDGRKFTSADVVATMNYMSMYTTRYRSFMQYVAGYYSDGDHTFVLKLNTPKTDFANNLDFPILPDGLMADDFILANTSFAPNGTGMYRYKETIAYKDIVLSANENWHNGSDRAYIDEVHVEILADEETLISAFDAGAVDALSTSWKGYGELELASEVYTAFENEQNRFNFIGINCQNGLFDTAKERRALQTAIDTDKICRDIMLGHAVLATSPIRDDVYYNPSIKPALVTETEENDTSQKNIRKSTGDEPSIQIKLLYNSDNKTKNRLAVAVKQQLDAAGYIVQLDGRPEADYLGMVALSDYDLYLGEVQMTGSCDLQFMFASPMGGICNYDDSEFRNLVTNLDLALSEEDKMKAWESFEKYYTNAAVQIPLYFTNKASFINKRISGKLRPNLSVPYYGLDDMYLEVE